MDHYCNECQEDIGEYYTDKCNSVKGISITAHTVKNWIIVPIANYLTVWNVLKSKSVFVVGRILVQTASAQVNAAGAVLVPKISCVKTVALKLSHVVMIAIKSAARVVTAMFVRGAVSVK